MIRYTRKEFYFIDTSSKKERCGDSNYYDHPEEFWDDKAGGCVKLMHIQGDTNTLEYAPQDIHDKLWGNNGRYDLDVKKTYQKCQ